ncbi:MAG: hypothetical protein EOO04_03895 [Chitinophagaceae bacterium]|nr:MAG: hypothetical protein EOO04_03895 [Chitinophagaceae bacterium]
MKATLKLYSLLFLVSTLSIHAVGSDNPLVEKKKTVSKTYTLSPNDLVTLDNRFGELKISTWDKNEIKVEITMTAKGNTEERANDILGRISIDEGKKSNGVYFRTVLDSKNEQRNNNKTYKDEGFNINYVVVMPARNRLDASNEFGATTISDFNGEVSIESKFGSLTTGKLVNNKQVTVEFGSAEIASISNGELEIKFSRAIIGNLDGNVVAKFEHCSGVQLNIDNNLKGLVIKNEFTNLQLNLNKSLSAKYNISTNFGDFTNKTDFAISNSDDDDNDHGPRFKKQYTGKSGNGAVDLKITAEFSNITVGHGLKMDLKDEKKKTGKTAVNI